MATIGTIYNKNSFENLIDFDSKGNWEIVNGKLHTTGGNSILQLRRASALDSFVWKVRTDSPDLKIKFSGIRVSTILSIQGGKLRWDFTYNNTFGLSSGTLVIDPGDVLEYIFDAYKLSSVFTVNNITKGTSVSLNIGYALTITAHKLVLYSPTALNVISLFKSSVEEFQPLNLLVGDSIAQGAAADIPAHRWGVIANFSILGSSGDTSLEALDLVWEIVNVIKPKRVIYAMGTNDLDIEVWKSNLMEFKLKMDQYNLVFIPITPYANSLRDMSPYQAYIQANFNEYFDLYSLTKQSGSSNMKTEYNSGDHVHPNTLGHQDIANFVLNSPYYVFVPIISQGNTAFYRLALEKWHSYN